MVFDYSKLLGLMKEKQKKQSDISRNIGINEATLNLKLNNKAEFKQTEILDICNTLDIVAEDVSMYFFTPKV